MYASTYMYHVCVEIEFMYVCHICIRCYLVVLQCVEVCFSVMQCVESHMNQSCHIWMSHVTWVPLRSVLQCCSVLQRVPACSSVLHCHESNHVWGAGKRQVEPVLATPRNTCMHIFTHIYTSDSSVTHTGVLGHHSSHSYGWLSSIRYLVCLCRWYVTHGDTLDIWPTETHICSSILFRGFRFFRNWMKNLHISQKHH